MTLASLPRLLIAAALVLSVEALLPTQSSAQSSAQDSTTIIDFENYPANRTGTPSARGDVNFYRGAGLVFVREVTGLVYDERSIPDDPDFPRSGSTIITTCYSAEFCSNDIEMLLATPHQRVELWVGYDRRLPSAAILLFEGFDEDGQTVAADRVEIGPSDRPVPVDIPLTLDDPEARISRLRLRWQDETRFLSGLAVDDLELTPIVVAASAEFSQDSIVLDGSNGPVSQDIELRNTGNVTLVGFAINLEAATPAATIDPPTVDASDCDGPLPADSSCTVSVRFEAADDGRRQARLVARDAIGRPLASATVEAFFDASTTETTETPETTQAPETTVENQDPGGQSDSTNGGPTTASVSQGSTPPTENDDERSIFDPATIGGGILLLIIMGALLGLRRPWRRRSSHPAPPAPEPRPPKPLVKPTVQLRPGTDSSEVLAGRGPLVSLRASIDIGRSEIEIKDSPRPNAATPPINKPAPEGSVK